MQLDPERRTLKERLWKRGLSLSVASMALGRNKAYLHQYLVRGMPRVLSHQDSAALGALLDCDPDLLRHARIPPRKPWKRRKPAVSEGPAAEPETEAEASAGPCVPAGELSPERARWQIPDDMIRREGGADPARLLILRLRGDSREAGMREGDRLIVDTARRDPAGGELFVLREDSGIVVKRIERLPDAGSPRLRLISPNPEYPLSTRLAAEVEVVGKVIWTLRRE